MNVCKALELDSNRLNEYTKDDIKQHYKKIALECHPDKLNNIENEDERNQKIEKFKQASIAYKVALDDLDKYGKLIQGVFDEMNDDIYDFSHFKDDYEIYKDFDMEFWESTIDMIKNKDFLKNTLRDVASFFLKNNFHPKTYYHPSPINENVVHQIVLPVSYYDLCKKSKKKLRLVLKGVDDPVFLNIYCKKDYPCVTRQYIDDDGMEHEIVIQMKLDDHQGRYSHIMKDDGTIDLVTWLDVTWLEYLTGGVKNLEYIDGSLLDIELIPFSLQKIVLKGKGVFEGDLIIHLNITNIQEKEWKNLDEIDKKKLISVLKMI